MNLKRSLLIFFLSVLFLPVLFAAPQEINIRVEYFPPFVCGINSKTHPGIAIEILRKVFPADRYRLNFRNQGWQWAMRDLQRNQCHAVIGVCKADKPNLVYPSRPLFKTVSAVYLRNDSPLKFDSAASLAKAKTGFMTDYSHSDEFDRFLKDHSTDGIAVIYNGWNANDKMVRDLMQKKLQAIVSYTAVMDWSMKRIRNSAKQIRLVKKLDNEAEFYIAFTPGKRESWTFVKQFNQEFEKFRKTPEYKKLLQKYGLTENSL